MISLNVIKVGETLTDNADGNTEQSLEDEEIQEL